MDSSNFSLDNELLALKYALMKRFEKKQGAGPSPSDSHGGVKMRNETAPRAGGEPSINAEGVIPGRPWFSRLLRIVATNTD